MGREREHKQTYTYEQMWFIMSSHDCPPIWTHLSQTNDFLEHKFMCFNSQMPSPYFFFIFFYWAYHDRADILGWKLYCIIILWLNNIHNYYKNSKLLKIIKCPELKISEAFFFILYSFIFMIFCTKIGNSFLFVLFFKESLYI